MAGKLTWSMLVAVVWLGMSLPAYAQGEPAAPAGAEHSVMRIIFSGGPVGVVIMMLLILLSVSAMALMIEHSLSIRRPNLIPEELEQQLTQSLSQGQVGQAISQCQASPSCLASMVASSLAEVEIGWPSMEKALEEEAAEQAGRLFRKIEYLSLLGTIAPMLGLLGTVVGMLLAFREVADTQGAARASELASGIYQALVTTVAGLLIAIPSLAAYAVFRNRVDALLAESVITTKKVLTPVKRALLTRKAQASPPRGPAPPA